MKKVPVKLSVLKLIQSSNLSCLYRLQALLSGLAKNEYSMSEIDHSTLLESASCSLALNVLFDEYFEQAHEASVEVLYLYEDEFKNVIQMAKIVERSNSMKFGQASIWTH